MNCEISGKKIDTIFEDKEENMYEVVSFTTDYTTWYNTVFELQCEMISGEFTDECLVFAQRQNSFMTAPVAKVGFSVFMAATTKVDSLEGLKLNGPLYMLTQLETDVFLIRYGVIVIS
mgnify:CR=1 FL=1